MAERLVIVSDMWGTKKGLWITSYLGYLQQHYDIVFYDCQELANINLAVENQGNLHEAFVNGGIATAVHHLIKREKEEEKIQSIINKKEDPKKIMKMFYLAKKTLDKIILKPIFNTNFADLNDSFKDNKNKPEIKKVGRIASKNKAKVKVEEVKDKRTGKLKKVGKLVSVKNGSFNLPEDKGIVIHHTSIDSSNGKIFKQMSRTIVPYENVKDSRCVEENEGGGLIPMGVGLIILVLALAAVIFFLVAVPV
jgi:hypothetical protein